MSTKYPSFLYRNPLLMNRFLTNIRDGTPINLTNTIDLNVEGDDILHKYIVQLNEDTFMPMPDGLGELGEAMWVKDNWSQLMPKIADESRKHGWMIAQFYDEKALARWRVFSVQQFTDFLKETVKDDEGIEKQKRVGMKLTWADDIGNSFTEEVKFDDPTTFLFKWREGNGMAVFAFPDLSQAIMTLVFEYRQITGELTFEASKPSIIHVEYGEAVTDATATKIDNVMKGAGTTSAIGAPKAQIAMIESLKNENLQVIIPALDKQIQRIAGITQLPMAYFLGEKQSSGMSDMGEKTDMLKVIQKKAMLFEHYRLLMIQMFRGLYNIEIDPALPKDASLEEVEEDKENNPKETNNHGQKSENANSGSEAE